jgi:hypothetical protein
MHPFKIKLSTPAPCVSLLEFTIHANFLAKTPDLIETE